MQSRTFNGTFREQAATSAISRLKTTFNVKFLNNTAKEKAQKFMEIRKTNIIYMNKSKIEALFSNEFWD